MTKIVAFGSFDPLHKGHISYLKQAKELGDELVVIVASDEKIRNNKNHEPRQSQEQRLGSVAELGIADKVVLGEPVGEYKLISQINPDIIALGYDQKIPEPLKNKVKKYKIITLKPYQPEIYKSSKIAGKACVYILKNLSGKYYIGSTADIIKRLKCHNAGRVISTKSGIPWELVHSENFKSLKSANKREYQIKSWKSRSAIEKLMKSVGGPIV